MTAPQTELENEIVREWRKNEEERESGKKREKGRRMGREGKEGRKED